MLFNLAGCTVDIVSKEYAESVASKELEDRPFISVTNLPIALDGQEFNDTDTFSVRNEPYKFIAVVEGLTPTTLILARLAEEKFGGHSFDIKS